MKIGIYGGTFNPPHTGHIRAAESTLKQLGLDLLLVIPAGIPPHKNLPDGSPSPSERLEMTVLAFQEMEGVNVSDMEIIRDGKSFTVDTINAVQREYPDAEIYLLMGPDMLDIIEIWKNYNWIMENVTLAVFARGADEEIKIAETTERLKKKYLVDIVIVRNDPVEISSSELRELLKNREGIEYVSEKVYSYINKNHLYGVKPNFQWLRQQAYAMLKPSRISHVEGCEEEAVRLARRWYADENRAREAAILHDITKKLDLGDQLILCEKYGIMTDNVEKEERKLLHAKTGAAIAKEEYGMPEDVCNAILYHTTGRPDMTTLEKVIYLADYIEPNRDFEGLKALHRMAYENLDQAIMIGLQMSINDMKSRGITPHWRTTEAIRFLTCRASK